MKIKVYAIFYNYNNEMQFEAITTNFKKWLKEHNEERKAEGNMLEDEDDFAIYEDYIVLTKEEAINGD